MISSRLAMKTKGTQLLKYITDRVTHYEGFYKLQRGQAFMLWYAVEALGLDQDTAYEAVSYDRGNDKSIDFFFVDDEYERLILAQGKFNQKGAYKPKTGEFLELVHATDWLRVPETLVREGRPDLAARQRNTTRLSVRGTQHSTSSCTWAPRKRRFRTLPASSPVRKLPTLPPDPRRSSTSTSCSRSTMSTSTRRRVLEQR